MKSISSSFIFIILIIANAIFVVATYDESETEFISVVFRHGDRTPDASEMISKDNNSMMQFFPMGYGGLTNDGKRREFQLGQLLREKYNDFLGDVYMPESVFATSTDYARTKMSLQLALAGLYPPAPIQKWNEEINWQPIPTSFAVRNQDWVMGSSECIEFIKEYFAINELPEVKSRVWRFEGLMRNLTQWTGKEFTRMVHLYSLYHLLTAESFLNMTLPYWAAGIFPYGELYEAIKLEYELYGYTSHMRRINGGKLLYKIVEEMKSVERGKMHRDRRISLYSGHETNVAAMLQVLGLFNPHVPPYSSAVVIELVQKNSKYFVKVFYYQGIPSQFVEQTIPGCASLCPFSTFLKLYNEVIPTAEEIFCKEMYNFETLEKL